MAKEEISPRKLQEAAKSGFQRIEQYRHARNMFLKAFVGQYYRSKFGVTGAEPLNLMYNAIRVLVPNLVMKNPVNTVKTRYTEHKLYAELLGLGINIVEESIGFRDLMRAGVVDACFGFAIFKAALNSAQHTVEIDNLEIDPGQIYIDTVSVDDFTFDPYAKEHLFNDASFLGHSVVVPRATLLDDKSYNTSLVEALPSVRFDNRQRKASEISEQTRYGGEFSGLRDLVRVVELYLPDANAIATIPDPRITTSDKFVRVVDYYGPDTGPYTFLSFTQPVPDNPIPIAPVSIWYDLHNLSNQMFKKIVNQAMRQKDIGIYKPAAADTAVDIKEATDGEMVASDDPSTVQVISFGGQQASNENMLVSLQTWFSLMAGNIEQLGGTRSSAATATQAEILQGNANVTIEDSRDIIYECAAKLGRNIAWFLHYDPMLELPVPYKLADNKEITVTLTPEERRGDFIDFAFKIKTKSMVRLDPTIKSQRVIQFATNVMPGLANTAQMSMRMGTPFNFAKAVMSIAEELDIADDIAEFFNDPDFERKLQTMMKLGPQNKKKSGGAQATMAGITQNGGLPTAQNIPDAAQQANMNQQERPAISQAARLGGT